MSVPDEYKETIEDADQIEEHWVRSPTFFKLLHIIDLKNLTHKQFKRLVVKSCGSKQRKVTLNKVQRAVEELIKPNIKWDIH